MSRIKKKLKEWLLRYGPAEVVGTIAAVLGSIIAHKITNNIVISAYIGSLSENLRFYLVMLSKEYRSYTKGHPWQIAKNLFLEFGLAEISDTFFIRPLFMGAGILFLGQGVGLIVGKLTADILFYLPTIVSYELRKKSFFD